MNLKYIGLSQINGPLVVLDKVSGISYDEMAVLIPDHIFSKNLKRTVKKAKAILYGRK